MKLFSIKVLFLLVLITTGKPGLSQCPSNIDFELGDFTGWKCWTGTTYVGPGNKNVIDLTVQPGPVAGRHTMLSAFPPPGNGLDQFGQFPQNCPNGSGHSIKLGNTTGGHEAEGVSYTFTIPAGQNKFNLIYNYAVVFQGPQHQDWEQPRLVIEINNITDGVKVLCSSFDFFYKVGSPLPGFFQSTTNNTGTPVWCKDWSANTVNLDGLAGKTVEVFFKTADCVFTAHFGYAYIDLNTECSSSFIGATYCPDDAFINVTAPFGYETYRWWYLADPTVIIGNTQTINFTPPPPAGTSLQVAITPFAGYGCNDTLTAILMDTLTIFANAGPDKLSCNNAPVQLGVNPRPGFVYSWSPATGLSNPNISNPIATPSTTTQYVLIVTNTGGGCLSMDTVIVSAAVLNNSIQLIGPSQFCLNELQKGVLKVMPADSIQWYLNNVAIPGANATQYNPLQSGSYHATLFSFTGCSLSTVDINMVVDPAPLAGFTINSLNQCFKDHQFVFTNTSSIPSGILTYQWDLGDGNTSTSTDVTHSYSNPGTYTVKLMVTSDNGCKDSISFSVKAYDSPVAGFTTNTNKQCFKNNRFVFTNTSSVASGNLVYSWDLGDATFFTSRDVTHSYSLPGNYVVKLLVITNNGCKDSIIFNITVDPSPVAGFTVNAAQQCFTNNQFIYTNTTSQSSGTTQYLWNLGDGSTAVTANVSHNYTQTGDFKVTLIATSDKSCADTSSFNVKIYPFANADFAVKPVCINIDLPLINKTINNTATPLNYLWDFGNGRTSVAKNPVYSYPLPGTYTISLSVNTNQCPQTFTIRKEDVVIDAPVKGIIYPEKDAVINFPEPLEARQIGQTILWKPPFNLDNRNSYRPTFRGLNPQLYTIELKTLTGCLTVDTQMVKVHKKIEIYVPTVFTPGGNGLNDYLRPLLMGFSHVTYFRVFNRWGKLLFQMQSDRPGWDGKVNNIPQEMQTVVWMIEAVDVDGKVHKRQGTTVLMR